MQVNCDALTTIFEHGGHFVLAKESKRPLWRSWGRLRPSLDIVQSHDGPLGVIPWSLRTTGIDIDRGDPHLLLEDHPALADLASRRPGGRHLYYADTEGRGNGTFSVMGCSGDIRGANGYFILWGDGPAILADALGDPIARARHFPADLWTLKGLPAVTLPTVAKAPTYRPSSASRATWVAAAEAVDLERVQRGQRNMRLFDAIRFWCYSINKGLDVHAYLRRVRVHALECNRRLPEPLPSAEVVTLALSISTWCWSGGGARWHFDHSSAVQRRRGLKSGKVRRAKVAGRDRFIVDAYLQGASMRSIAAEFSITARVVHHIVHRSRVLHEPNQCLPWAGQGLAEE